MLAYSTAASMHCVDTVAAIEVTAAEVKLLARHFRLFLWVWFVLLEKVQHS